MTRADNQRVVATGIGVVTPVGNDAPTTWSSLLAGRSGIGPITAFDTSAFKIRIAGEVKDFDPTRFVDKQVARRMELRPAMRRWPMRVSGWSRRTRAASA